jgi:hypothetical protein
MKKTLQDIHVEYEEPIMILCDNTSAINISKNPVMHSKTNHIQIKFHFLREQVIEKNINLEHIGSKEKIENIFTKPIMIQEDLDRHPPCPTGSKQFFGKLLFLAVFRFLNFWGHFKGLNDAFFVIKHLKIKLWL